MRKSVAKFASRGVGCADHVDHEVGHVPPPLMPLILSGPIFYISCRKCRFAEALLAFRWATHRFFSGPSVGHVAHIPWNRCRSRGVWPTGRPVHDTRGPHIPTALLAPSGQHASGLPQHNGGAGSAPRPASPTRVCHVYGAAGALGVYVAYPAGGEAAGRGMGGAWHQSRSLAVAAVPAPAPAQRPVAPTWLLLRRTSSQTPCGRSIRCGRPCRTLPAARRAIWGLRAAHIMNFL